MQTNIPRKVTVGMWVMTAEGQVGILTEVAPKASVDLVNEDGTTSLAVQVLFTSLRQAMLDAHSGRAPAGVDGRGTSRVSVGVFARWTAPGR